METRSLPLQNVRKVRCKLWGFFIKPTPLIRFIIAFHKNNFFGLALIKTPIIQCELLYL